MPVDRRDLRRRLFAKAADQGGYFTAAQAKSIGYSYQAQAHHVAAGNWHRVDRGLFRLTEWIPELHDDLRRWTLWSKGRAIVSHETALSVHGVGEFEAAKVLMTVPPCFTMTDDALTLHHAELDDSDIDDRAGFGVTTVTRSLIDVAAAGVDEDQLARAIDDALRGGSTTQRLLRSKSERVDVAAALHIERALGALEQQ